MSQVNANVEQNEDSTTDSSSCETFTNPTNEEPINLIRPGTTGCQAGNADGKELSNFEKCKQIAWFIWPDSGADRNDHHVHFDTASLKDDFESDTSVTYQRVGDTIVISLGFLQVKHRYSIDLNLPTKYFPKIEDQFVPDITTVPNLHCRITEFSGKKHDQHDFYEMKIEFYAYKEKALRELLHIVNASNSEEILQLVITARVLGKGKGTPMLRTGIHCIGMEEDATDSDSSDVSFNKK